VKGPSVRLALLLTAASGVLAPGCGPPPAYVRYDGGHFGRTPKPVEDMDVLRAGPPATRYHDLGTVIVTCPSETSLMPGPFGMARGAQIGGCNYSWAVRQACERASAAGADGIHSIETATNSAGAVVSLRASVFVRLPKLVAPAPPKPAEKKPEPSVKERLQQLDELKADELVTPEEYAKKRAEILDEI
jgi:hypothetical protein